MQPIQATSCEVRKYLSSGLIISALRGGSGKTVLTIGIIAALKNGGFSVSPFKKGPDYIDAGWLALAAGRPCYNLDTFLVREPRVVDTYLNLSSKTDISIVEGNRGLYDGIDIKGKTSTAELAKLLKIPVILSIDCTKSTRTMAAAVMGCMVFDPGVDIRGVILNRVAGPRHEGKLRNNIEHFCKIPVLGAVPKLGDSYFPERHMGLIPTFEHSWANDSIKAASDIAEKYIDLKALKEIAISSAGLKKIPEKNAAIISESGSAGKSLPRGRNHEPENSNIPKIGILKDSAFQFYYPDNIDALKKEGAEIVYISPLKDKSIPDDVDALYIGGGFPETHASDLAENRSFRESIKAAAESGMPVYAECGGLMFLGRGIAVSGKTFPMTGVLPLTFSISKKPQGHGYTSLIVDRENPFFEEGTELKGHEFRYSRIEEFDSDDSHMAFSMKRGTGIINKRDGFTYKNILASYTHLHSMGSTQWAPAVVRKAVEFMNSHSL